ncbi:endonuclease [Candidatus Peregrinibacteria bacterium CG10_big_fil_rev_8_21_14_0_10_55_24]|nr:MAG: endonuclease [Candidatus Peregrinibacteria bacterium CG10_big_fil_rev_8_21_14_0_10_55_24]
MYYVYVVQNPKGKLYKGFTNDLEKRIIQHNANDGFSSYTNNKGPWKLVHREEYANEREAREREKFLKTGKGREFLKGRLSAQADG